MSDSAGAVGTAATDESWVDRLGLHYALIPAVVIPLAIVLAPMDQLAWLGVAYPLLTVSLERIGPRSRLGVSPGKLLPGDLWFYLFIGGLWTLTLVMACLIRAGEDADLRLRVQGVGAALQLSFPAAAPGPLQLATFGAVLGLLYGVNTNVAHDLIHRTGSARKRALGFVLFALCGDGQLAVSHMHGHHINVATAKDPASSRAGEVLYAFFVRSTLGQYRESWEYERSRLAAAGKGALSLRNRVLSGVLLCGAVAAALGWFAGWKMVAIYLVACFMGKFLFETANYVQHYGIVRLAGTKCGVHHSWDSDVSFSRTFMFNQNRHAQHHARAGLRYWELEVLPGSPKLPYGYLTMFLLAMVPPVWFRLMDPHREAWLSRYATAAERYAVTGDAGQ